MTVIVLLLLWIMSIIIIIYNEFENKFNYWYSGIMLSITLGIICEIIRTNVDFIITYKAEFDLLARFLSALSYRLSPYFGILCAIEIYYQGEKKRKIYKVLFLPVMVGFIADFIYPENSFIKILPDYSPYFWTIVIWAVPYILVTNILMFLAYVKETSQRIKQQKLLICILFFPSFLLVINAFMLPLLFGIHPFKYDLLVYSSFFLLFVIFAIRYGIMGIKISLEKIKMDVTMKVVSTGTMILVHALKNELTNIAINSECLDNNDPAVISIRESSERLLKMTQRINMELKDIHIVKEMNNLSALFEEILDSVSTDLEGNNIKVIKSLQSGLMVEYDIVYFKEAIQNIIKNAIEAMNNGGLLELSTEIIGKQVLIKIKDNGNGISKENLKEVLTPFFSTKKNIETNYGLGLTNSYRIIQLHKGTLEILSKINEGTTVLIRIPKGITLTGAF